MLHELTHNVHGPHDDRFYAFLDKLTDEYDALRKTGYSGEGFLSDGYRVGQGVSTRDSNLPMDLARLKALEQAEKRRKIGQLMGPAGGQRLGSGSGTATVGGKPRRVLLAEVRLFVG
jgi:hypothetical protein